MEWIINTQLGRRNLIPAQKLAVLDKFKERVAEEAKEKQGARNDLKDSKVTFSPNGEDVDTKIHTDKEVAKMAGVGTGTVRCTFKICPFSSFHDYCVGYNQNWTHLAQHIRK